MYIAQHQPNNIIGNILGTFPGHIYWNDPNNMILGCNDEQITSMNLGSQDKVIGRKLPDLFDNVTKVLHNNTTILKTGRSQILREEAIYPDGITKDTFLSYKEPIFDKKLIPIGIVGWSFNINSDNTFFLKHLHHVNQALQLDVKLTWRETECIHYLTRGKTAKEIAYIINTSPKTVEYYIANAKYKLDCFSTSQLLEKLWYHKFPFLSLDFLYFNHYIIAQTKKRKIIY